MFAPVATTLLSHPVLVVALHRAFGPTLIDRVVRGVGAIAALTLMLAYVQVCQQAVQRGQRFVAEHRAAGLGLSTRDSEVSVNAQGTILRSAL